MSNVVYIKHYQKTTDGETETGITIHDSYEEENLPIFDRDIPEDDKEMLLYVYREGTSNIIRDAIDNETNFLINNVSYSSEQVDEWIDEA